MKVLFKSVSKSFVGCKIQSRAAKSFGGFKILSRLQNALACAKSWVTALRLQNALLASHYLAAARNMLWTHEKCSTQKSRILVSGLENEGTFQAVSNFFVGCEIQQGLQNPSRASKSFEGCKILWSLQNPESAAKSFRGFKILSRLQNPLACAKSWMTAFKLWMPYWLHITLLLRAPLNMLWTYEKCPTKNVYFRSRLGKWRCIFKLLQNPSLAAKSIEGFKFRRGLQKPLEASKSWVRCQIVWRLQNPKSAAKSSGVSQVISYCFQAAECLTGFTLPSCCELPWRCYDHTKSVQPKNRVFSFPAW